MQLRIKPICVNQKEDLSSRPGNKRPVEFLSKFHIISRLFSSFSVKMLVAMLFLGMQAAYADCGCSYESSSRDDVAGAVFVATNPQDSPNRILMYHRHHDGTLSLVPGSPFLTGGIGTGAPYLPPDALSSQSSLIVDEKNKFLFVVNAGSNEVSVFRIHRHGLRLVETVSSGGVFPNSLATRKNILYVLNSAGITNFTAFKVGKNGHLKRVFQCDLLPPLNEFPILPIGEPAVTAIPSQIGFTPDGKQLIIVRKEGIDSPTFDPFAPLIGPGHIDIYALNKKGLPVDCQNPTSNISQKGEQGRMPFSFIFSKQGDLLVTEIFGSASYEVSPLGAGAMSSYKIERNGKLKVITQSLPNGGTASCWNVRVGKFVYVANNSSSSISLYQVNKDGSLKVINELAAVLGTPTVPGAPLDMSVTANGRFLYAVSAGVIPLIYEYEVNKKDGSLTPLGTVSLGDTTAFSGQMGMAIVEFPRKCR